MRPMVLNAFLIVLAIYGALVGSLYLFQRSLIYHPGHAALSPAEVGLNHMGVLRLETSEGLVAVSWYGAPDEGAPVVVYFQGNAGTIADRAHKVRPYLERGFGVLLVGYRGYGANEGKPSEAGLVADGRAALGFLQGEGIAPARWVLYGESIGSGVAVELAREQAVDRSAPVGAVVLEAPFTSLVDMGRALYPFAPISLLLKDRFESLTKIAAIKAPLVVVHGSLDLVVPQTQGQRLFEAAEAPKTFFLVDGAGHNNLYDFGAEGRILGFLAPLLAPGR